MALVLLALLACTRALPPVTHDPSLPDDAASIAHALAGWNAHPDLPDVEAVDMLVQDAPDADAFVSRCHACPSEAAAPNCVSRWNLRAHSCAVSYRECSGPFCGLVVDSTRLIVLSHAPRGAATRASLVRHEAIHHIGAATGMGFDASHSDERRWPYHCGQDLACRAPTVEERARAIARQH